MRVEVNNSQYDILKEVGGVVVVSVSREYIYINKRAKERVRERLLITLGQTFTARKRLPFPSAIVISKKWSTHHH